MSDTRPDPDALLSRLELKELKHKRGRLKIFFGAVAGVGKTFAMLEAAQKLKAQDLDLVVGYVETHGRLETDSLLNGLEILPAKKIEYRGTELKELDIDLALTRKPALILVDELAHTNAPGCRHSKRWQDVSELLEAGIDVYTTLNVQHVESLHDVVAQITKVSIRERVPDSFLEKAEEIALVDLPADALIERLRDGKVYMPAQARAALENFFRKGNLIALRELALRFTAERVVAEMEEYRQEHKITHTSQAAEHLLVCVSPSPLASRLVRAGKRMAEALRAKWIVVYVDGGRQINDADRARVIQTLRLGEQLGAETLELSGSRVPEEIIRCARQYNVSKIIIGKPAHPRWREIIFGSFVDDVIRLSGAIDIYVITGDEAAPSPPSPRKLQRRSKPSSYLWSVAVVVAFTFLAKIMLPYFELSNVVMSYLLGVVLVAVRFGRGPSILASILAVAAFDFFCVPPYLTFAVSDTQYVVTFAVMLAVALLISSLTVMIKQQAETARLREMRTASLYSMSRELSTKLDMRNLVEVGLDHISSIFESKTALLMPDSSGKLVLVASGQGKFSLETVEQGIAAWVHQNKQRAGLGTDTLPGAGALYLPLLGAEMNIGVLVVCPKEENRIMSPEQFRLLETFANQIALACERAQLSEEGDRVRLQIKTEQLRNSLLSSVSHDLRTPLATISGAASSILEATHTLDMESCKQTVKEIYDESMRLNRLIGNLLDMTKLQSGSLQLVQELHPVDEVIGAALNYMDERAGEHTLTTRVPGDLSFILVDAILIQQVLVNLIENACKYAASDTEVEISAEENGAMIRISVSDRGPGIKDEHKKRIFEKFYRENPQSSSGAGLGLAICSAIIEAHHGEIWVEDRPGGGAIFRFTVPMSTEFRDLDLEKVERDESGVENE